MGSGYGSLATDLTRLFSSDHRRCPEAVVHTLTTAPWLARRALSSRDAIYAGEDFVKNIVYRALALAALATLAIGAVALAGPLSGKTYRGHTGSSGTSREGFHESLSASTISLAVGSNGKAVYVRFSSSSPILYCETEEHLHTQSTKWAPISHSGTFRATIAERLGSGTSGAAPITQVVSGKFSGHTVKGTVQTQAAECSGTTSFSATAP